MDIELKDFNNFMQDCRQARQTKIDNQYLYMFTVTMSKPVDRNNFDKGWLTLFIRYEMQKFSALLAVTEKPLPEYRGLKGTMIEIPQKFADEIKVNQAFRKTLLDRLNAYATKTGKAGASFDKVFQMLDQRGVSVARNNQIAKAQSHNVALQAKADAIKTEINMAAQKFGNGQKWSYYREYYRGPYSPAHDDDYEGSGEISFEDLAISLCTNVEQVQKLAAAPAGARIEKVSGHYRTIYSKH